MGHRYGSTISMGLMGRMEDTRIPIDSIKKWWVSVLAQKGKYPCYVVILFLPTDYEALEYLLTPECLAELDLIYDKNCLVLAASDAYIRRSGVDETILEVRGDASEGDAPTSTRRYLEKENAEPLGYCRLFGQMLQIPFDQFPCMVLFRDLDSPKRIIVSLRDMEYLGIALRMRAIFAVVATAASRNKDPLVAVRTYLTRSQMGDFKVLRYESEDTEFAKKLPKFLADHYR